VPDKKVGLEKSSRVHLWIVPAQVAGNWCGIESARGIDLHVRQEFQQVRADITGLPRDGRFEGRLDGISLMARATGERPGSARLQVDGFRLKVLRADGSLSGISNAVFAARAGGGCAAAQ